MVDLKPFDLKRIELNYFRKRKGKKEVPANENKRDNGSGVLEKIEEDPELDDPPENYMRRKTKQPRSSLMPSECTNSCPSKLSSEPCQELSQQSQRARLSRHALEDEGSKSEWLDLFDSDSRKWRVMSPRSHVIYNEETLKRELNGAATVLLYAVKNLEVKAECEWLFASRNLRKVEVKDVTFRFADNIYYIQQRRHRLGVAAYLAELMRLLAFRGSASLLKPIEHQANAADQRHFEEVNSASFPRNTKEMKMSDLYVTPSLISKFHVLKESAEPFPDLRFREELVFRKADLVHLHSKYGWVDVGRMVREDASAVRVTMTRAEDKELKLYTYSQTEPFRIVIEDGKFLKNEYGSIYINRKAEFPEGTVLVQQPVRYVCKKNGIEHTEVIRGFTRGRPNAIGFLLFKADKDRVLQLYEVATPLLRNESSIWRTRKSSQSKMISGRSGRSSLKLFSSRRVWNNATVSDSPYRKLAVESLELQGEYLAAHILAGDSHERDALLKYACLVADHDKLQSMGYVSEQLPSMPFRISRRSPPTFAASKKASVSSKISMGALVTTAMANCRAMEARDFSPPDSCSRS